MVLTQLAFVDKVMSIRTPSFPYHYGSYATGVAYAVKNERVFMFPYHYGSYAT